MGKLDIYGQTKPNLEVPKKGRFINKSIVICEHPELIQESDNSVVYRCQVYDLLKQSKRNVIYKSQELDVVNNE